MNPIDQIAAEADEKLVKIPLFPKFKAERVAIIQAAIEKATEQERHDDAMEFSELVWFACLVEPFVSDHWSGKKDELSQKLYKACLRIRPITDKYQKNIPPTPATASEQQRRLAMLEKAEGIYVKLDSATASERCWTEGGTAECLIHPRPDSASAGKYKHEYADHLPATDATDHAATPSGGGEWTHEKLQGLLGISHEDRLVTDQHFENTLDEINATLQSRDPYKCEKCGKALGWCEPCICDECKTKEGK